MGLSLAAIGTPMSSKASRRSGVGSVSFSARTRPRNRWSCASGSPGRYSSWTCRGPCRPSPSGCRRPPSWPHPSARSGRRGRRVGGSRPASGRTREHSRAIGRTVRRRTRLARSGNQDGQASTAGGHPWPRIDCRCLMNRRRTAYWASIRASVSKRVSSSGVQM